MTLNGIKCLDYAEKAESFVATLSGTQREAILLLDHKNLKICTDTGTAVVTFTAFGPCSKITEVLSTGNFEVEFERSSAEFNALQTAVSTDVTAIKDENRLLKARVSAANEKNTMLEDCLVELAGEVYA